MASVTVDAAGESVVVNYQPHPPARFFAPDSIWNTGIGSGATFEANTSGTPTYALQHSGAGAQVNSASYSVAVGYAKASDPWRTVICETSSLTWSIQIPDTYVNGYGQVVPFTATGGSDGWVTVVSADGRTAYEFYAAKAFPATNPNGWSTKYDLVITDTTGHGLSTGRRASGTSQLGGLILADELEALYIPHMLSLAIPASILKLTPTAADGDNRGTNSSGSGWVWPARGSDNQANIPYLGGATGIAMGAVFGIPPSVNIGALGLNPYGLAAAEAAQDRGVTIVAQANTLAAVVEPAANQDHVALLRANWATIVGQLRRVTNHKGGTLNAARVPLDPTVILGGGTRP
jgi:hypothetical protein